MLAAANGGVGYGVKCGVGGLCCIMFGAEGVIGGVEGAHEGEVVGGAVGVADVECGEEGAGGAEWEPGFDE